MAWRMGDSFRHYGSSSIPVTKWLSGPSGIVTIRTDGGRDDGPCLSIGSIGLAAGWIGTSIGGSIDELICGVRCCPFSANWTVMQFRHFDNNATHITVGVDSMQRICAWRGTQASGTLLAVGRQIPINQFSFIEAKVKISDTIGTVEVRLNGSPTPEFALTAQDTCTGITPLITHVSLAHYSGTGQPSLGNLTNRPRYCDFYLCDTTGAAQNDFLGEIRGDIMAVDGPGANQDFTPSTGTDHEALIDEVPPSATDYLESSVTGDVDTHTVTALTGIDNIIALQINNWMFKSDAGYAAGRSVLISGATTANGDTLAAPLDPIYQLDAWTEDPNTSAAWTLANINAIEVGTENVT